MDPVVNTVTITTKKLFQYDKIRKEEGKDWDEVNWEEEMEDEYSEDCDTFIKIINKSNPVWKEMFEMQKRTDGQKFCDVNILGTNGYVPCHRVVLMEKSEFLSKLITNNMKINVPFSGHKDLNNIISICIDVDADILKHVVTLFYTGFCIVANSNEEEEVKDLLKLLQVDIKGFTILDAATSSAIIKKKKIRHATVCRFADSDQQATQSASAARGQTAPSSTVIAGGSNEIRPRSSAQNQMPGPSPAVASSSQGFADAQLPEIRKVPPGSFPRKPAERIQRKPDDKPSTSSTPAPTRRPPAQDDSDSDEPDALRAPLPVVQKVPPGTLLQLHKQPRIIRNVSRGGRRRRGRGSRGGRGRGYGTRSTDPDAANAPEDEDSNGPKGRYEQDNDYVPSTRDEFIEEEDVELESVGEEESVELSDNENRRPRTRTSTPKLDEEHGRYPKRRRREEGSYAKIVSGKKNPDHSSPTKSIEIENSPRESLMDAQRPARTRGTAISPASKLRSLTSHVDEISQPQCLECKEVFQELEELKSHLDTKCGKFWTGQYDLFKQYCGTCKSYFKQYALKEFLEHVNMCVLSASVRSRRISAKSTDSNKVASTSTSPVRPAPAHFLQLDDEPELPAPDVKDIAANQKERCDIIGLTPVKCLVDRISSEQIERIKQKLRQGENVTSSRRPCPSGFMYVSPYVESDEGEKVKEMANLDAPAGTSPVKQISAPHVEPIPSSRVEQTPALGVEQSPAPRVEQTPALGVEQSSAPRVQQTPVPLPGTRKPNETLPSASASSFSPDFTSTPLSPKAREDIGRRADKLAKPRPGPLRSKKKAVESENSGQKAPETQAIQDESKSQTATNSELENDSEGRLIRKLPASNEIENNIHEGTIVTAPPPSSNEQMENIVAPADATCKGTGSAALNATASRLKATLKKKLNTVQSCTTSAWDTPQKNTTTIAAITVEHGPNQQFEGLKTVDSTSEAAESVEADRPHVPSQKSNTEKEVKTTTAGALYNKTIEQLVSRAENTTTGGTSNVPEHNQQRYSPISSASSRTSTPENRLTPSSQQQQQQQQPQSASTAATTIGTLQYSNVDNGPRTVVPVPTTSAPTPPPTSSSHAVSFTSASQNLHTLIPAQRSTQVNSLPVMQQLQQVQQVRFPGQQPIPIRRQNTAIRSQLQPPRESVPPAMPLGSSGIQHLTSQTTIHPVVNSSVAAVSQFHQTRNPTVPRTQNTYSQQALPGTTNASLEFEGGLEVRRVDVPQPAAQPTVRTVSPANGHTQQAYQQQQQQRYTPPTSMNNLQQHIQRPLTPTGTAILPQTYNTGTSQARQSPILNNAQPRLPIASTVPQQGYQNLIPQSQPVNHGTLPQNSQAQHAQYIRPMTTPIQNQAPSIAAVPTIQQFVPPSYTHAAPQISQNRPVPSTTVVPQNQQYQQQYQHVSSTPAAPQISQNRPVPSTTVVPQNQQYQQQYQQVSSTPAAPQISQNRPVPSTTVVPQNQQYQQVSSTPAMPQTPHYPPVSSTSTVAYQQHQSSQQVVPTSRSVHVTHDGMLYNRVAAAPPSSTPNVSIMQNGAGGYMSSQVNKNGNGSSATVRLPVSPFMNPLVNNRSGQGMVQQQTQQLQIPVSATPINSIQSLAPAATLSSNITSSGQASSEPGRVTCDDCGDTFETQKSYTDHKNDGFC